MHLRIRRSILITSIHRATSRILNILVIFSLLIPNLAGIQSVQAATEPEEILSQSPLSHGENSFQSPKFEHAKPKTQLNKKEQMQNTAPMTFECVSTVRCESGNGWVHITYNGSSAPGVSFYAYPSQSQITLVMAYDMEMHATSSWARVVGVQAWFRPELQGIGSLTLINGQGANSGYIRGRESVSIYSSGEDSYTGTVAGGSPGSGSNYSWDFKPNLGSCGGGYCTYTFIADVYIFIEGYDPRPPTTVIDELSVLSNNACSVSSDSREGCLGSQAGTQGAPGGPISSRTGTVDYHAADISVPTSSVPLVFERWYTSHDAGEDGGGIGYGWHHNQDSRLIFPADPGGEDGFVLFKAHSANRYRFTDNGDGTYTAGPGVAGTLSEASGIFSLVLPTQDRYTFDSEGKIISWEDDNGHILDYSYNLSDQLAQVSADGGSRSLSLSYDAQDRISTVIDHTGRQVSFTYDPNGNLVSASDLSGGIWQYSYDTAHRLTEVIDPDGYTVERTEYDTEGLAVRQYDGLDNLIVELSYNQDGTTTVTDALGNASTHTYDTRNTLTGESNPLGNSTTKSYDANFRPRTITDEDGNTTSLSWSDDGANLTHVVDAAGHQTEISYDALNNPTSVTDPQGYLTSYAYSGSLLSSSTDALSGNTSYTYTPEGYLESVTDPLGHTTAYTYDSFGQRISMTDALGNVWNYAYDNLGRMSDTIDPLGRVTHNEYDNAGRMIRTTVNYDPGRPQNDKNVYNNITEFAYDARGNQISVTDTLGRIISYDYDANGRLVSTTDPAGNVSTTSFDAAGQPASITDVLGRSTSYGYDAAGRLVSTTDPLGNSTTTAHNPDGTIASSTDALGHSTNYSYDELKRVVTTTDHLGYATTNAYDVTGNLVATTDKLGNTTSYEYDALGRMILQRDPNGGETETFYDAAGNRIQTIDPLGNATTYAYDYANRMDSYNGTTSYDYNNCPLMSSGHGTQSSGGFAATQLQRDHSG